VRLLDSICPRLNLIPVQMDNRVFIGIDPGIKGGIAFIYNDTYYAKQTPPTVAEMADELITLQEMGPDLPMYCCIESVHSMPGNSGRSMFTFGTNYGEWLGILATLKIPYIQVTPHKWMKHYPKAPKIKKDRKNYYKHLAQQRCPKLDVTLATSDAILIANYMRETNKN